MGAAGLEAHLEECGAMEERSHAPGGDRWLAGFRAPREPLAITRVASMERCQPPGRRRVAVHEREVGLLDGARLKLALKRLEGGVVLRHHQTARSLLVQAVDDAGPEHASHAGQAPNVVQE